jgi:hypothetical protein
MKQPNKIINPIVKDFDAIKVMPKITDKVSVEIVNMTYEKERIYLDKLSEKESFKYPIEDNSNLSNVLIDDGIIYNNKKIISDPKSYFID